MTELSEYYSGKRGLGKIEEDATLKDWFMTIANKIEGLSFEDAIYAGRKI
jgi:hypothetical protein